ncbi:MAG: hypothetical protein ACXW2E_01390 [Nitrososphaeraceae archaeon]
MKLLEVALNQTGVHSNITSWITKAKPLVVEEIKSMLENESKHDANWFVTKRGSRITQLVSEILTLKLKEVSNDTWDESDFEGHQHSDQITAAIRDVAAVVSNIYRQLRVSLISAHIQQQKQQVTNEPKRL